MHQQLSKGMRLGESPFGKSPLVAPASFFFRGGKAYPGVGLLRKLATKCGVRIRAYRLLQLISIQFRSRLI